MDDQSLRPAKRTRGSYARLICFRCRERRIKCLLANDGSVQPSSEPQPSEKACQRCQQHGLECIVRKTTLGRPNNQKRQRVPSPNSTLSHRQQSKSPTPDEEELVLLTLNEESDSSRKLRASALDQGTGGQVLGEVNRAFELTSALLAQDRRFGTTATGLKSLGPKSLTDLLSVELVELLDQQPLALIDNQQAASHTLSGNLYGTLIHALQQRLGLHNAPGLLRTALDNHDPREEIRRLAINSLRWCASLLFCCNLDIEEAETTRSETRGSEAALKHALESVHEAIHRHFLSECFLLFYALRYHVDDWLATREVAADWKSIPKLAAHIEAHVGLRRQRRQDLDEGLTRFYFDHGPVEEGLALAQLLNMEHGEGYSDVLSLAMFYAIMGGTQTMGDLDLQKQYPMVQLSEYYTKRVDHEASIASNPVKSEIFAFLDRYGDAHMDALERRLTEFINTTSDATLQGVPFVGPPRHTCANVLMACKAIAENNAVRIKIDGSLHERVDMQLILFQEAARRLEAMEANGDTSDAIARGSVLAASAKLVRALHRVMWQWKRNYAIGKTTLKQQQQQKPVDEARSGPKNTVVVPPNMNWVPGWHPEDPFADSLFDDWNNWSQLGPNDLSGLFTYDFDIGDGVQTVPSGGAEH
ncbi:hypothetical protein LTR37_013006 [Vermiconidia calcicola]|uniref:Uncharacterized protein n=1 Tax=Vermiconidia calcicola TaxID=1690605 RepID=A0ACC3MXM1_9PEZI|nr:hypothetical protein LTR37_013006 [Vermiconidia calcicola]